MQKLVDKDGFVVCGCWEKATTLVVNDKLYLMVDRTENQKKLNDTQMRHKNKEISVHDPVWYHFPKGKENKRGVLKVFPSIAQQWKNFMNKKYVKPHTYPLDNVDSPKFDTIIAKYCYEFSKEER